MVSVIAAGAGIAPIFDERVLPEDDVVKLTIIGSIISSTVDIVSLAQRHRNQLIGGFLGIAKAFLRETTGPANRTSEQ